MPYLFLAPCNPTFGISIEPEEAAKLVAAWKSSLTNPTNDYLITINDSAEAQLTFRLSSVVAIRQARTT